MRTDYSWSWLDLSKASVVALIYTPLMCIAIFVIAHHPNMKHFGLTTAWDAFDGYPKWAYAVAYAIPATAAHVPICAYIMLRKGDPAPSRTVAIIVAFGFALTPFALFVPAALVVCGIQDFWSRRL